MFACAPHSSFIKLVSRVRVPALWRRSRHRLASRPRVRESILVAIVLPYFGFSTVDTPPVWPQQCGSRSMNVESEDLMFVLGYHRVSSL